MFKYYKQSKLSSRLLITALILALGEAISWRFGGNPFVTGLAIVALSFIGESFFFHKRLLAVALMTLGQLAFTSTIAYVIYTVLLPRLSNGATAYLQTIGVESVSLAVIILTLVGNYFLAQGRFWINTLVTYLIYDSLLIIFITIGFNFSFVFGAIIAFGSALAYIVLRHFLPRRKVKPFDTSVLKNSKATKEIKEVFATTYPNMTIKNRDNNMLLVSDGKVIYAILPLNPKKYFSIIKNEAWLDSNAVTGVFEYLLDVSKEVSSHTQINKKNFVPVIYVANNSTLKNKLTTLKIRSRRMPDKVMGNVFIATPTGFAQLIKGYSRQKDISASTIEKLKA